MTHRTLTDGTIVKRMEDLGVHSTAMSSAEFTKFVEIR